MIIITYNEENIITRVLVCDTIDPIQKLGLKNHKIYKETNTYVGLNLDFIDNNGMIKTDEQLLNDGLVTLAEDEILDRNTIRKLTLHEQVDKGLLVIKDNEEIRDNVLVTLSDDEMKEKYPELYPDPPEPSELEQINQEISSLEYDAGMEIVRELGRQKLLSKTENTHE